MSNENFFFGVFPEREAALEIGNRARQLRQSLDLKGNLIAADRLHISLLRFNLHAVDHEKLFQAAEQAASGMLTKPFNVAFDHVDSFESKKGRYPLVLLSDHKSAAALAGLHHDLSLALKKSAPGMKLDLSINPHVTLMYAHRKIEEEYPVKSIIRWKVKEFALVRSLTGKSIYVPLGKWRLGA